MGKRPGKRWHHHAAPSRVQAITGLAMPALAAGGVLGGHAATVTVRPGDTLSGIAQEVYGNAGEWPELYAANRGTVTDASLIYPGEILAVPRYQPRHARLDPAPVSDAVQASSGAAAPAPQQSAPQAPPAASADAYGGSIPGGAFGQCVVARESGGNAQVMNSSGHYGLYQFSEPTWVAYGGSAADFGHASVAEQDQVFASALAAGGQSNWSPYDGCTP